MAYRPALPPSALNHLRPGVHYVVTTVAGDRVSGAYGGIEVEQDDWSLLLAGPDRYESVRIDRVASVDPL